VLYAKTNGQTDRQSEANRRRVQLTVANTLKWPLLRVHLEGNKKVERPSDGRYTKEIKESVDTDTGDKVVWEVKEKKEGLFMR
jgi:NADPH-dependent ferric siderophore reductase